MWLRQTFLPQLPAGALVAIAGRTPPDPGRTTDPGWSEVARVISLRNLRPEESRALLADRRVPAEQHTPVLEFTHGHPLALSLVADAIGRREQAPAFRPDEAPDVVRVLPERFVADVPGPRHRRALEICAHARFTTEALLGVVAGADGVHELFDWLRGRASCLRRLRSLHILRQCGIIRVGFTAHTWRAPVGTRALMDAQADAGDGLRADPEARETGGRLMTGRTRHRGSRRLRRIAALLVRGPDARSILDDMDELFARDVGRGASRGRAALRYARNLVGSAYSVWRAGYRWRSPRLPGVSWLDVKLGVRLLVKHPALTLAACFALAIGIPVGLAPLQMLDALSSPPPFDEGDHILGIKNYDVSAGHQTRPSLHDFETWQSELESFERLAAFSNGIQNLVGEDGTAEPVRGSEVTASAFGILRVRPMLGRMLRESDESKGSAPVVLLRYDLWQRRFGGDTAVLGQAVHLGGVRREVVGVMPPGFKFPYPTDGFWVPLQARSLDYERGQGPRLVVFGRLRDEVSLREAQAEATAIGLRAASDYPETHEHLRPEIVPFFQAASGLRATPAKVFPIEFVALLLLAVACGNVGTLILARAAARSSEIAVRTALGARRGRIIAQLFVESLVLATVAAGVGLGLAELLVSKLDPLWAGERFPGPGMPIGFDLSLTPRTVALGGLLALFSAVIAGVLPAIKATGKNVQRSVQRAATGESGIRFGAVATVLIVAEVALAVGFLSVVGAMARNALLNPSSDIGVAATEYLSARLTLPVEPPTAASMAIHRQDAIARFAGIQEEMVRRVTSEPRVRGVALASALPGMDHAQAWVEVEGEYAPASGSWGYEIRTAAVDLGFFRGLGQPVLEGRDFYSGDLAAGRNAVIVNRSFVDRVLHGKNAIGRRIRFVAAPGVQQPWYEIVGVVDDLGMNLANRDLAAGLYHPVAPGAIQPVRLAVQLAGDPSSFAPRLRAIVAAIDPAVIVDDPVPLDAVFSQRLWEARFTSYAFATLASIAVILSVAGLYALMSFMVSERTYEIAIRSALGAQPRRVVAIVLIRALIQLAVGVALGTWMGAILASEFATGASAVDRWPAMVATIATVMTVVGLLACTGPTLRALRIQPIQALRERT